MGRGGEKERERGKGRGGRGGESGQGLMCRSAWLAGVASVSARSRAGFDRLRIHHLRIPPVCPSANLTPDSRGQDAERGRTCVFGCLRVSDR